MKVLLLVAIIAAYFTYAESAVETKCFAKATGNCKEIVQAYKEMINKFVRGFRRIMQMARRVLRMVRNLNKCNKDNFRNCRKLENRSKNVDKRMENHKNRINNLMNKPNTPKNYVERMKKLINGVDTLIARQRTIADRHEKRDCDAPCTDLLVRIRDVLERLCERLRNWFNRLRQFLEFNSDNINCFKPMARRLFQIFKQLVNQFRQAGKVLRNVFSWSDVLSAEPEDRWDHPNQNQIVNGNWETVPELVEGFTMKIKADIDNLLQNLYQEEAEDGPWNEGFEEEKAFFEQILAMEDLEPEIKTEVEEILAEIGAAEA